MAEAEVVDEAERDEQIYRRRLAGLAVRVIAQQVGCSVADVNAAVERRMIKVDNAYRVRAVALDLENLDRLQGVFMQMAANKDVEAGGLVVRIMRRRAEMLGTDSPMRVDPIQLSLVEGRHETSTENLRRIFEEVMSESAPPARSNGGQG